MLVGDFEPVSPGTARYVAIDFTATSTRATPRERRRQCHGLGDIDGPRPERGARPRTMTGLLLAARHQGMLRWARRWAGTYRLLRPRLLSPDIAPAAQPRPRVRRRRIELPEQRASPRIERAHGGARRVGARHVVDRGADNQPVVQHGRRRIEREFTGVLLRRRVRKGHRALVAELGARASRREVEFDHSRVQRRQDHACAADSAGRRTGVMPDRDAAADEVVSRFQTGRSFGSNAQSRRPVSGSSAITRSLGVQTSSLPSARSGVSSKLRRDRERAAGHPCGTSRLAP